MNSNLCKTYARIFEKKKKKKQRKEKAFFFCITIVFNLYSAGVFLCRVTRLKLFVGVRERRTRYTVQSHKLDLATIRSISSLWSSRKCAISWKIHNSRNIFEVEISKCLEIAKRNFNEIKKYLHTVHRISHIFVLFSNGGLLKIEFLIKFLQVFSRNIIIMVIRRRYSINHPTCTQCNHCWLSSSVYSHRRLSCVYYGPGHPSRHAWHASWTACR